MNAPFGAEAVGQVFTSVFERVKKAEDDPDDYYLVVWGKVSNVNAKGLLRPKFDPGAFGLHSFIVDEGRAKARIVVQGEWQTPWCNHFSLDTALGSVTFWERSGRKFLPTLTARCEALGFDIPLPALLSGKVVLRRGEAKALINLDGVAVDELGNAWLLTDLNTDCFGLLLKHLIRVQGQDYGQREFTLVPADEENREPFVVQVEFV